LYFVILKLTENIRRIILKMVKKAVNGVYGNLHKGTPSATDFSCLQVMGSTEASLVNQE